MTHNAHANIETANADDRLENYSRAERMRLPFGIAGKAKRFAKLAEVSWLNVLETATAPALAVTKCNYARECRTPMAK